MNMKHEVTDTQKDFPYYYYSFNFEFFFLFIRWKGICAVYFIFFLREFN